MVLLLEAVLVHPDDHLLAAVHRRLPPRRALLDAELGMPLATALVMPPSASTSPMIARPSASADVRLST